MPDYFYVLGRDPVLASAELISYLSARKISEDVRFVGENIAIVSAHDMNLSKIVSELGGTVKAGLIVAKLPLETKEPEKILDKYPFWTDSGNKIKHTVGRDRRHTSIRGNNIKRGQGFNGE